MLLQSELERAKYESGYNLLTLSALPYAIDGITQLFEQIVQPYLQGGALTSSTTTVLYAGTPAAVTLTLASNAGFNVGDRIVVDEDYAQEYSHVRAVSTDGVSIGCALHNAHSGTYPVTVEGGESIIRQILRECIRVADLIARAGLTAGLAQADDAKLFASRPEQRGPIDELLRLQKHWRNELCNTLGLPNLREQKSGAGQALVSF